eukprot:1728366-Alexandrium_andersonii.AAC.1
MGDMHIVVGSAGRGGGSSVLGHGAAVYSNGQCELADIFTPAHVWCGISSCSFAHFLHHGTRKLSS